MATVITDVNGLQAMENDLAADYELGNNIDASATSGWNGGLGFDPVGQDSPYFTGSFDGKGYTVTDLFINRPLESVVGLFGYSSGVISNVGLVDCDITGGILDVGALVGYQFGGSISDCYSTGSVTGEGSGAYEVGGLVGAVEFLVTDCYSTCTVTATDTDDGGAGDVGGLIGGCVSGANAVVTGCYATGAVSATSTDGAVEEVGGFTGDLTGGTVSKCYATGNVTVTASTTAEDIGGFAGINSDGISDCYARGDLTVTVGDTSLGDLGGFVGDNRSSIDDCYSTGSITKSSGMPNIGGFCGFSNATITNCFWDTQTSGEAASDGGTGKTTTEMKTIATFTDAGWDFTTIWGLIEAENNGYPFLPTVFGSTVTTQANTNTIAEQSTGWGTLTIKGGSAVTQYGHVWSTSSSPTTSDSKTELGAKPNLGQFKSTMTDLLPSTLYYVKAYVVNTSGTSYGDEVQITTTGTIANREAWEEDTGWHYFDQYGVERVAEGEAVSATGAVTNTSHLEIWRG